MDSWVRPREGDRMFMSSQGWRFRCPLRSVIVERQGFGGQDTEAVTLRNVAELLLIFL